MPAMAGMPDFRIKFSRPFIHTIVDLAGPTFVKQGKALKKVMFVLFLKSQHQDYN